MRNSREFPATVDIPWILYTKNVTAICQNFQTVLGDKIQVARGEKNSFTAHDRQQESPFALGFS